MEPRRGSICPRSDLETHNLNRLEVFHVLPSQLVAGPSADPARRLRCAGTGHGLRRRRLPDGAARALLRHPAAGRSEEHTSELQSLMRISYAVFCLKKKKLPTTRQVRT